MSLLRRTTVVAAAAAIATAGLVTQPAHAAEVDVYTTPGGHIQNGRLWDTDCSMYSSSVVRCTTNIWATQIVYEGGRFVNKTGWHFNNLTYLPSTRSSWEGNPLARSGEFTSAGRQWNTECDTPATGRGACRAYIMTNYIATEDGRYVRKNGYVFNNLVRFAEGSVAPVSKVPAHILDQSLLTPDGLGPLSFAPRKADTYVEVYKNLERLGYVAQTETEECVAYNNTAELEERGIDVTALADVAVSKPGIKTEKGAEVGMTIGEIKELYGSAYREVAKENHGEKQYFGSVKV
ncbi:MAG: hypothetical protein Q4F67_17030, partial [Propionibacteriaceae bacterium]|nr:hypothetical protein [Propionibacteriaceae bacterium]